LGMMQNCEKKKKKKTNTKTTPTGRTKDFARKEGIRHKLFGKPSAKFAERSMGKKKGERRGYWRCGQKSTAYGYLKTLVRARTQKKGKYSQPHDDPWPQKPK